MNKQTIKIYHNNRCSKSRCALDILEKKGFEVEVVEYLKKAPSKKELKDVLAKLGVKAIDIVRKKEELYLKNYKDKKFTNEEWIEILCNNPILIERPIVVDGYAAIVARPPELLEEFLGRKKPKI